MRTDMIATCLFVAMVVPGMALGADQFTDRGIAKIQADLGPNCPTNLEKVGQVLSGNNGLRQEQWFVKTCHGVEQYWVSYYPPQAFPDRSTDLEVEKVVGKVH